MLTIKLDYPCAIVVSWYDFGVNPLYFREHVHSKHDSIRKGNLLIIDDFLELQRQFSNGFFQNKWKLATNKFIEFIIDWLANVFVIRPE